MQYRRFGLLDWKPSALGFGAMRLPVLDNDPAQIDEVEAIRMVRFAIDHGVNYVDTAYSYHGGTSEIFLGRALREGYRDRIRLATKSPTWKLETPGDFDRYLDEQLERLQTSQVDFYLLHGLNEKSWNKVRELEVLRSAERALADGRIGHLGFSFHDKVTVFEDIIDSYDGWVFCQIQYNFMDVEYQAGTRGLWHAAAKGLGVVVMEPIRGGRLSANVPPAVQRVWDSAQIQRTPAEWALQWVWNHVEVSLALSGMSTMQQVHENVASAERSAVGGLTQEELDLFARAREAYEALCVIPCTDCKYCLPCPSGVNIPRIFQIYNDLMMYGDTQRAKMFYGWLNEDERASMCIECGECLERCPQQIEIPAWLAKAHEQLCPPAPV